MKQLLTFCILASLVVIVSCNKDVNPPDYIGTWNSGTKQLTFKDDNTYTLVDTIVPYVAAGTYTVDGTIITVQDNSGGCKTDTTGSTMGNYIFKYVVDAPPGTGNFQQHLTISISADSCDIRKQVMPGTYDLVKPK